MTSETFTIKSELLIAVAIDLIVQHIRDFLNNRQKKETVNCSTETESPLQTPTRALNIGGGGDSLKRPH